SEFVLRKTNSSTRPTPSPTFWAGPGGPADYRVAPGFAVQRIRSDENGLVSTANTIADFLGRAWQHQITVTANNARKGLKPGDVYPAAPNRLRDAREE